MHGAESDIKRCGILKDCIKEVISTGFSGEILYRDATIFKASVIFVSGEPAGAEYTDGAGSIFGDTAILRLPTTTFYEIIELPVSVAQSLAKTARLYHPQRLYAHASMNTGSIAMSSGEANVGTLSIRVEGMATLPAGLRIELLERGFIVASDTPGQMGSASFRLLKGEYQCRLRDGIRIISELSITFPGGDIETTIHYRG